ncbi:hypothetical protein M3M35_02285 [Fructilactobacillus myrtifloralis]|uniref:Uncharacterized protein n=1 Tax=Fructilactobacillus myrtifloralis TaxID=2940301 RepID=A0ABY5BP90_9LACO|nr:hypothetical protein [Fructilactobacillus myrtifloralis]USS85514.1 hypothetical protein M3M35_02285 [Fructilactobacillus myrtifloralis]
MDDKQTNATPEPELTRAAFRRQQRHRWGRPTTEDAETQETDAPLRRTEVNDPERRHRRTARKLDIVIVILVLLIIAVLVIMRFVD